MIGKCPLRMITEGLLRELMFDVPSDPTIKEIIIDKDSVEGKSPPKLVHQSKSV